MARDYKKESTWANQKYGPEFRVRFESPEQREKFVGRLENRGLTMAEWFRQKVREELTEGERFTPPDI
jgi:hypothetical protein